MGRYGNDLKWEVLRVCVGVVRVRSIVSTSNQSPLPSCAGSEQWSQNC